MQTVDQERCPGRELSKYNLKMEADTVRASNKEEDVKYPTAITIQILLSKVSQKSMLVVEGSNPHANYSNARPLSFAFDVVLKTVERLEHQICISYSRKTSRV